MKKVIIACFIYVSLQCAVGAVSIGQRAPDFSLIDSNGHAVSLGDYRDKIVVLEWTNPECPYVQKHYRSGNMQKLQKEFTAQGVIWLTIDSAAPGKEGYLAGGEGNKFLATRSAVPTALLFDPKGTVGHLYEARTTPHMFVIDSTGALVYAGGIDSIHSSREADIPRATNYVAAALREVLAGKAVTKTVATPYGCSVKY